MPNLNISYQWAINACNAPNIGYSQTYRRGQTVNGITYYDCSSFISKALTEGGFFPDGNPWFTTHYERNYLTQAGFVQTDIRGVWMAGDVVWRPGHTEMVYQPGEAAGTGVTMGAHTGGIPLADQVSINSFTDSYTSWESLWRYPGGAMALEWVTGNRYLTDQEMHNNAYCFYSYMYNHCTIEAIAGMLGSAQSESKINPGVWQNLDAGNYNLGYGLFQWTPATNYTNWAVANGYDIADGNPQCEWVLTQTVTSGQWIATSTYPQSFPQFLAWNGSPEDAASIWLHNFERPKSYSDEDTRRKQARYWYEYLRLLSPWNPGGQHKRIFKWWLYLWP